MGLGLGLDSGGVKVGLPAGLNTRLKGGDVGVL